MVLRLRGGPPVGLAVGGAKDISTFRSNIKGGTMPDIDSITAEGLFNEYFFDTGDKQTSKNSDKLFFPTFSFAKSPEPISNEDEHWMTVGLNSSITDFDRKELNLVILLDISGSMSSEFGSGTTKIKTARETIINILSLLNEKDKIGIVLFDDKAETFFSLEKTPSGEKMATLKSKVLAIACKGSTNMEAGYMGASEMISEIAKNTSANQTENRILVLTDDMPNVGSTGTESWIKKLEANASQRIYTTFIGIGVDFDPKLIQSIAKVKGTNYYSTSNSAEFKKRLETDFKYLVTPLVFDMKLSMKFPGFEIEKVYGNPDSETKSTLLEVSTFFASPVDDNGRTKGGIILLKLKRNGKEDPKTVEFEVSYTERDGVKTVVNDIVTVPPKFLEEKSEFYENLGARKAIVLARLTNLMKNWIKSNNKETKIAVSNEDKQKFSKFYKYVEDEIPKIGDNTLENELQILDILCK